MSQEHQPQALWYDITTCFIQKMYPQFDSFMYTVSLQKKLTSQKPSKEVWNSRKKPVRGNIQTKPIQTLKPDAFLSCSNNIKTSSGKTTYNW